MTSTSTAEHRYLIRSQPPEVVAYAAGIFDGEGCINLHDRREWRLSVQMTDEKTIRFLAEHIGGYLGKPRVDPRPRRKISYSWYVSKRDEVEEILTAFQPYAITKRAKALEALESIKELRTKPDGRQKRFRLFIDSGDPDEPEPRRFGSMDTALEALEEYSDRHKRFAWIVERNGLEWNIVHMRDGVLT